MSCHYYDLLMLDRAGITAPAVAEPELLEQGVRNKAMMFADASASYPTATLGSLRLLPSGKIEAALTADYAAMAEMFMSEPSPCTELIHELSEFEKRVKSRRLGGDAN